MKGQYSFTNVITQRKSTTSRKKVQFFEEANQNVQNMISDILLTIDEEDKTHLNIPEKLQSLQKTKQRNFKQKVKRVKSSKRITRRKSIAPINSKNINNYQTYLCTNQTEFFKQLEDSEEEASQQSSFNNSSFNNGNKTSKHNKSSHKLLDVLAYEDMNSFKKSSTIKLTSDYHSDINHSSTLNMNENNNNIFRFPTTKRHKHNEAIVITRCDSSPKYNNINNQPQRFSILISDSNNNNNTSNVLGINSNYLHNNTLKNNSSLGILNNKKQKNSNRLIYDLASYDSGSRSAIFKNKKDPFSSPKTPEYSSQEENNDDAWGYSRKKSYSNYDRITRQSKVRNIEKQIRESFNIQQKKKQLRESVGNKLNVRVLPHEIEREFEHFVTESNDEIYKYQTLCSELRISMLHHGIRPAPKEPKNSNKSLKEESLQQFKQLHNYPETENAFDLDVSPTTGNKTSKNSLFSTEQQKSSLSNFSTRSAVAAIILNKEEKEFEEIKQKKKIIKKTFTQIQQENELEERKKKEALLLKEQNYRSLFRKNNPIYDSLSDQEMEDDQLELDHFYITPDSTVRKVLDGSVAIFAVLFLYLIPIEIAFIHTWENKLLYFNCLYMLGEFTFIMDFILSFFMAYFDLHDNLITHKEQIRMNYMSSWFVFDFITALPTNTIINGVIVFKQNGYFELNSITFTNSQIRFVHLIKLLKTFKILKICSNNYCVRSIVNHVLFSKKGKSLLLYVTLIAFITSLHILTCLFIFFGFSNYPNWILKQNFHPKEYAAIYIAGIYFLVLTIVGVGYGDILGTNKMEKLYLIFLLVIGVLLYSWLVSTLSKIKDSDTVIAISERAQEIKDKIIILETIRQGYPDMTYECYKRIQRYLKYNFQKELFSPKTIFDNLPLHLQRDLIFNMYKPVIENFVFFKYFKNEDFIMKVLMCFQPNICLKNERIVNRGDFMDEMLFVRSGKLAIELPLPSEITAQLTENKERKLTQYLNEYKIAGITTHVDSFTETKHDNNNKEIDDVQYVKLLEIHKNEHYGDIVMFLNKRSPLGVRVCTRKAELFYLKKADAISISMSFPSIWKKLITNSLFNMKQISSLIKKTLNYFYEHNKKILQKLISQNESYFNNMKNTQINVNPPDVSEHELNETDLAMHRNESNVNDIDDEDKEQKDTGVSDSNIIKTHLISESSNCLLINNSEEGLLAHEEQKGNLKLNPNININITNTNSNNNNSNTNVNLGLNNVITANVKSKFSPYNKQLSNKTQDTNIIHLHRTQSSKNKANQDNTKDNSNDNSDFIFSSRKDQNHESFGSILSPKTFQFRRHESISKQTNKTLILEAPSTPNILSQNSNFLIKPSPSHQSAKLTPQSIRSNASSAISSSSSSSFDENAGVSPKFIFDSVTPSFHNNPALIINNELYNGETLLQSYDNSKQPTQVLTLENDTSSEETLPQEITRLSKRQSDTKLLTTITNISRSLRKSNVYTQQIMDEFKHISPRNKDIQRNSIRERTISSKLAKGKKSFTSTHNNLNITTINNGAVVKDDKKKKGSQNFISQKHLPKFDTFLNKVNYTPTLTKRRLGNKRGTSKQEIKLEKIQNNIEQSQLNLKNPQMFYSEAFKEMINSREKNTSLSNLNKKLKGIVFNP